MHCYYYPRLFPDANLYYFASDLSHNVVDLFVAVVDLIDVAVADLSCILHSSVPIHFHRWNHSKFFHYRKVLFVLGLRTGPGCYKNMPSAALILS